MNNFFQKTPPGMQLVEWLADRCRQGCRTTFTFLCVGQHWAVFANNTAWRNWSEGNSKWLTIRVYKISKKIFKNFNSNDANLIMRTCKVSNFKYHILLTFVLGTIWNHLENVKMEYQWAKETYRNVFKIQIELKTKP